MTVDSVRLSLRLHGCNSLKDKRQILRGLLERCRSRFNVSICEVGDHDLWGNAEIGVSTVSSEASMARSILERCIHIFEVDSAIEVVGLEYW